MDSNGSHRMKIVEQEQLCEGYDSFRRAQNITVSTLLLPEGFFDFVEE